MWSLALDLIVLVAVCRIKGRLDKRDGRGRRENSGTDCAAMSPHGTLAPFISIVSRRLISSVRRAALPGGLGWLCFRFTFLLASAPICFFYQPAFWPAANSRPLHKGYSNAATDGPPGRGRTAFC